MRILLAVFLCLFGHASAQLRAGDLIFQTSASSQADTIIFGTGSLYSHMGMLLEQQDGSLGVIEAAGPVQIISLPAWIARGDGQAYTVLRDPRLSPQDRADLVEAAKAYLGAPYDPFFQDGVDRIYCSELIGLAYAQGLQMPIGTRQIIADLNVNHPAAQALIRQRWQAYPGCQGLGFEACRERILQSPILTPASIADDQALIEIISTF